MKDKSRQDALVVLRDVGAERGVAARYERAITCRTLFTPGGEINTDLYNVFIPFSLSVCGPEGRLLFVLA